MISRGPHWEETKRKWQESTGCFLIVSDCLVYFPRLCPPINPVICVGLGQSQSCVAMVRDCLHPVMLLSMWTHTHTHTHTHSAACPFVCAPLVSVDPLLLAQPPCCFKKLASDCVIVCCWPARYCRCFKHWHHISGVKYSKYSLIVLRKILIYVMLNLKQLFSKY